MRERRLHQRIAVVRHGITPACAGTTSLMLTVPHSAWDHPRLCGNDWDLQRLIISIKGSPPLVRERHARHSGDDLSSRITPACAGTTTSVGIRAEAGGDHPRLCGNDLQAVQMIVQFVGSPPLVRERRIRARGLMRRRRITPACAGTTPLSVGYHACTQDHPRLCGNDARM